MLDVLRKRKRSWIITLLLGLIIVVFIAFYGGNQMGDPALQDVAAVNGEVITQREFVLHYQRALEKYRELLKGSLTPELEKSLNLRASLLEELIEKRLVLQEARHLGLAVTDDDLMTAIAQIPDFQVNGRFNKERYLQLLRANRLSPAQFEEEQREQLTIQRLYSILLDGVHVTEDEVRDRYRFEQEKINLNFIRLPISDFLAEAKSTEAEIKNFYDRSKDSLKEPLKVQVEYLSYPFDRFSPSAPIADKEIEEYYQANREAKFHKAKEVKARYILVRSAADAKQKSDAQTRANRIVTEARAGKDFAQLAKQESADSTAAKGGDLGWLTQEQLPSPFDKAVFSLRKGEVSDAIETPAGFHIVKADDIREAKTQSLQDATAEITRTLKSEKGKREAAKVADQDREKALSDDDFAKLARDSNVSVKVTRPFTSGETLPEIGQAPDFYKTALSLSPKAISPVIEGTNAYYVLKIKERTEAAVPSLDTVRSKIEKNLTESKANNMALEKAKSLLEQLKKEKDIAKIAQQNGLKLEETGWFLRSAAQLPKIGELGEAKAGGIALSAQKPFPEKPYAQKDAAYVVAFKGSQGADMAQYDKEKEQLRNQAVGEGRQQVMQRFVENLKAKADVKIHPGALEEI
ncbi:MAG TPA: SurA N-terminal domain-containing protein [Candidatus Binatia bacterium]